MPPPQYRQGDLLSILQESRPNALLVERPGAVIVAGEATGHAHWLVGDTVLEDRVGGVLYLDIPSTRSTSKSIPRYRKPKRTRRSAGLVETLGHRCMEVDCEPSRQPIADPCQTVHVRSRDSTGDGKPACL